MLATEKQRKLDLQRFEVECASRAMLTEDVRSRAAWAYAKEIEAYNKEIVRLRLEEEERKMCLKREEDLKLALELEAEALRLAELDARVAAELKQKNITEENEKREKQLAKDMLEANKSASAYSMVQIGTAKKKGSTSWGGLISRPDASVSAAKSIREQPMICSQTAPSINDENNQLPSLNEIHQLQMEVLPSSVLDLIDEITSNALQKLEKKLRNRESAVCASFNLLRNSSNEHGVLTAKWESILSKAHLAWKLWLKEQPIEIFEAYTDAASQYHYADIGENLSRCGGVADLKTYAEYTVEDIDKLDFLENRIDLRNLILNVNNITSLQEISKLVELDSLSIKDNRLKNLDGLVNMKKLRSLVFDVNQVDDLSALRELPSLVVLSASTNCISEVPHLSSPHLQRLNLYHNKLSTIMSLTPIRSRVLTHLDLGRNKLHFVSGEALSQCQLLTQLILSQNCLEAVPFPLRLPNLKSLWISGNRLSGLTEWSPVYSEETPIKYPCFLPMLDKLYLQDNSIRTLKQQSLAAMPLLTHIDLSFNNIGVTMDDSSVEIDLSALRDCFLLRSVQLQDNPINVHSAAAVMSLLPNCPQLQEFSGVDIEHLKKKIGSSYHCQRDVHCILHQILENGSTDAIISSTLAATPAVHCHLFAGAASELKTRPNASFGLFGAPLSTNIGYNTYDRVLVEVITTLNSAAFSDKCVVKHENRLVRMKTSQLSNTSQEFNFDSLAQNGVDSSISLLLPLINIRLLFEWAPENSHMALYKTIACRGETGCEIKSKVPARVQQNIANSVTLIQKRYRGYRLRKQIQHALRMIYYNDDDLDDAMFSDDLLKDMEIPELDDNYWKVTLPINVIAPEPSQYSHSLTGSVVYGDHIRARGNSGRNRPSSDSSDIKVSICADELISGSSLEENRLKHGIRAGWAEAVSISGEISNGYFIEERECESSGRFAQQSISRPSTNMSNISVASSQAHSVDDFDYSEKSTPREYKDDKNKLANEWGFTNSSVIEAMKKRNKRMK